MAESMAEIEDGSSVTVDLANLQDGVDDADNDATNEFNTAAVLNANNELEITPKFISMPNRFCCNMTKFM